ncbi:hypothetical protein BGZ98_004501 [Dissophora globulifera]|nr:hypothetical protein BGZ98_004501 [Dissophora globulifera]
MAPANRAWIRSKMTAIKKASGIAFSEEIFLSILICLIAKNKHLVLHTLPETTAELKTVVEQHSAVVFGLTTATIVCHAQQTRADIIGAITGRHAEMVNSSTPSSQYQPPLTSYISGGHYPHHSLHPGHFAHQQTSSGQYYQHSNPTDENTHRISRSRLEKSRRSIGTTHSGTSDYSLQPSNHNAAPSISSFKTASERDHDSGSIRKGHLLQEPGDFSRSGGDSESRSKGAGDAMNEHLLHTRSRKLTGVSPLSPPSADQTSTENSSNRRLHPSIVQAPSHFGTPSINSGQTPVTPVDFTFPRRRHESVSNATAYGGAGGETSGVTYSSSRRIAQAIILDGLENASQEVYAILMEMIINKEINDRNRYMLPDLIIIAIFSSPNVPDNIPKQLLDYFAINASYQFTTPQPRIPPLPARRHALFRRTDWDELSKRMKVVTVSNDMMRYIRDVIVGVRTHEAVHGGLTSRAALDLEIIMRTLAAVFQTTFVTPDLLTIAADKVFSHRLELKSTRRRKMLSTTTYAPSVTSSVSPQTHAQRHGKAPMRDYQETPQRSQRSEAQENNEAQRKGRGRRGSTSSDRSSSSEGGASFVEIPSDSDERSSSGASIVVMDVHTGDEGEEDDMSMVELAEEKTAADVVRDVLRAVFPPI